MSNADAYLRAILATVARQTFPPSQLSELIGKGEKQLQAYNMCDGTHSQAEITKAVGLDPSNFSKTMGKWIDAGIIVRVGDGRESRPVHVYPLSEAQHKKVATQ